MPVGKRIKWDESPAKELMQMYVEGVRVLEGSFDENISEILGCTPDAVHIKARREMNDNPDSRRKTKRTKKS